MICSSLNLLLRISVSFSVTDSPNKRGRFWGAGHHIDIAEVRTEEGKLHLFIAIDRTSKFAFVQLHGKANRPTAAAFLEALIEAIPYRLHTILTPYEYICKIWTNEPERFNADPIHQMPGLNRLLHG